MNICESNVTKIIVEILRIIPIVLLIVSASLKYYEALKSKNEKEIKKAQIGLNIKMLIIVFIIFIPTFALIVSKLADKPVIYDCFFGDMGKSDIIDVEKIEDNKIEEEVTNEEEVIEAEENIDEEDISNEEDNSDNN